MVWRFFPIFLNFGSILGGPGPSTNPKKVEKFDFVTRSVLKEGSGRVLGGFWDGLETILKGFSMEFGMILGRIWRDDQ